MDKNETWIIEFIFIVGNPTGHKREKNIFSIFKDRGNFKFTFFIGEGIHQDLNVMVVFLSLVPGLIFLLIAKVSKEKIGLGDGWLFLIIAAWVGTETTWIIWYGSLLLSALFSIVMVILKKYKMQSQLPFIPFIWLAHLFLWSLNYGN